MNLDERMKEYEQVALHHLTKKQPVIIRLDGKAFHTFTKGLDKPFDLDLHEAFKYTCYSLKNKLDGVKLIYSQSDEISILLTDFDTTRDDKGLRTDAWFNYRLEKMISVSASLCVQAFNQYVDKILDKYAEMCVNNKDDFVAYKKLFLWQTKKYNALFDARAFNLPIHEVENYFIWRQQDAIRNSRQSLAQSAYSQKELSGKNATEQEQMILDKLSIDFNKLPLSQQRGFCVCKEETTEGKSVWTIDTNIPIFKDNRMYISRYLDM